MVIHTNIQEYAWLMKLSAGWVLALWKPSSLYLATHEDCIGLSESILKIRINNVFAFIWDYGDYWVLRSEWWVCEEIECRHKKIN